mgnify:FL=1
MYLTHFGRVLEIERLAGDMRSSVQEYVELGERYLASENRTQSIEEAMMDRLFERARAHGVTLGEDELRETFAGDVILNTQGIEFWLDHRR